MAGNPFEKSGCELASCQMDFDPINRLCRKRWQGVASVLTGRKQPLILNEWHRTTGAPAFRVGAD
jgi:hypothetical protein